MNVLAKSQKRRLVFLIILSAIGLLYGIYLSSDYFIFTSSALETQGQVVARDGSTFTIQYTVAGQMFQIKHSLPSTKGMTGLERARLRPGATVSVLYDPSSPGDGRWNAHNWVWPFVVIVLSVICGLAGFLPDIARKPFGRGKDVAG
jgi:Protein of unknown function (DUF3592)